MTRIAFLILFFLTIAQGLHSQTIDWLETVIIEEFNDKPILIKEMDSLKQRCHVGRELEYCTESERLFDSKVLQFRNQMRILAEKSELDMVVSEGNGTLDIEKYRFLIDYDFDLMNIAKKRSSIHYLKFDFIIIDLKNNHIVGRSSCENLDNPFQGFEYLLDQLKEFQNEGFHGGN